MFHKKYNTNIGQCYMVKFCVKPQDNVTRTSKKLTQTYGGIETAIFWQCSPGNVETQRLYPLHHGPRRAIKVGFFCVIKPIICSPYLVFYSRIRTEFVIVFIGNPFEMRLLNLRINFFFFFFLKEKKKARGEIWPKRTAEETTTTKQKITKMRTKSPQ